MRASVQACIHVLPLIVTLMICRPAATTNNCHTIQVYNPDFIVTKSVIAAKQDTNLSFYIQLESPNHTRSDTEHLSVQLSSLGIQPVVIVSDSGAQYGETSLDVEWNQNFLAWSVSTSINYLINCSLECSVLIYFSTQSNNLCVKQWKGALLNTSAVPLLDWFFNLNVVSDQFFAEDDAVLTVISHLQCHPDISVALRDSAYIGTLHTGHQLLFTDNLYQDASNHVYNICELADLSDQQCTGLVIQDISLTYSKLLLLTSNGLLVSNDIDEDGMSALILIEDLPFQTIGATFFKANPLVCQHPVLLYEQVFVVVDDHHEHLSVYTAYPPYNTWNSVVLCSSGCGDELSSMILTFNPQQQTYIVATSGNMGTAVHLFISNGLQLNSFQLTTNVTPISIHYHSTTTSIYLVGSEVWMSLDGGFIFEQLLSLPNNESVADFKLSEQALAVVTSSGRLYYGRLASRRLIEMQAINNALLLNHNVSKVAFDRSGQLYVLQIGNQSIESFSVPLLELSEQSAIYCNLSTGVVHHHLIYVIKNNSMCLNGETSIGMVVTGPSSLGKGVLADVGSTRNNNFDVGFVMMYNTLQPDSVVNEELEWRFQDEVCWIQLRYKNHSEQQFYELDVGDHVQLQVESFLADVDVDVIESPYLLPKQLWHLSVSFGNPEIFEVSTSIEHHFPMQTVTIDIWQKNNAHFTPFYSTVTFQLLHCPLVCERCTLTTVLSSSCPSNKQLLFTYPTIQSDDTLYQLPVNYRPPSHLGVAISTSSHIYNADPSHSLMNSQFANSRRVAQFKQCAGADTISNCACSPELETSTDIAYSDCIRKVYKHLYEEEFLMNFVLSLGNGSETVFQNSILIEELNNRTDFKLKDQPNDTVITMNGPMTIIFTGPGLYHFKATLLDVMSFCPLDTQFIIYVDRVPLTKAGEYTITILTTVLFGAGALIIYLVYNLGNKYK